MREALANTNNELIRKRRQKRTIKRTILATVFLVAVLVILCVKLSYFNVESIKVLNNSIVSSDEILSLSKIQKGTNIFYINTRNVRTNLMGNPYILSADIKRKFPNTISIYVKERKAVFYTNLGDKYLIIDRNGVVLEEKDNISQMKIISLQGLGLKDYKLGEVVPVEDKRKIEYIGIITDLISANTSGINITSVDISDLLNIKLYCGNICIKVGSSDIKEKLNTAINIILNNNLKDQKGYVDVSFDGNPVIYIEK